MTRQWHAVWMALLAFLLTCSVELEDRFCFTSVTNQQEIQQSSWKERWVDGEGKIQSVFWITFHKQCTQFVSILLDFCFAKGNERLRLFIQSYLCERMQIPFLSIQWTERTQTERRRIHVCVSKNEFYLLLRLFKQ